MRLLVFGVIFTKTLLLTGLTREVVLALTQAVMPDTTRQNRQIVREN